MSTTNEAIHTTSSLCAGFRGPLSPVDTMLVAACGRLAAAKRAKLAAIPGWKWMRKPATWDQRLAELIEFVHDLGEPPVI